MISVSKAAGETNNQADLDRDGIRGRTTRRDSRKVPGLKEDSDLSQEKIPVIGSARREDLVPELRRDRGEHRGRTEGNARRTGRGRNGNRARIANVPQRSQRKHSYKTPPGTFRNTSSRPFPTRTGFMILTSDPKSCTLFMTLASSTARQYRQEFFQKRSRASIPPDARRPVLEKRQLFSSRS